MPSSPVPDTAAVDTSMVDTSMADTSVGDTVTTTITVAGMSCAHCARAVREELGALGGVSGVEVDIASGRVVVQSQAPLAPEALRAAVEEAGYDLAP